MIQSTLQRIAEMKEKVKVLVNEIEILRQEIIIKDRELTVSYYINNIYIYFIFLNIIKVIKSNKLIFK